MKRNILGGLSPECSGFVTYGCAEVHCSMQVGMLVYDPKVMYTFRLYMVQKSQL
jgi:hypothetical protein